MARTRAPLFDTGISKRIWSEFESDMVNFSVAALNPDVLWMSMAINRRANKPMNFMVVGVLDFGFLKRFGFLMR